MLLHPAVGLGKGIRRGDILSAFVLLPAEIVVVKTKVNCAGYGHLYALCVCWVLCTGQHCPAVWYGDCPQRLSSDHWGQQEGLYQEALLCPCYREA